jgi:hypothetical protein
MVIAKTYLPEAALRKTPAFEILRRIMIAIQLLLLILLVVGRVFGASADTQLSHNESLSIAPMQSLSRAR